MVWVADWKRAQSLLERQLKVRWSKLLDQIADGQNPERKQILCKWEARYYWSTYQSEWATDVVFGDGERLQKLYQRMVRHSMTALNCTDGMRYLGRRVRLDGKVPGNFSAEVVMELKDRPEGMRIKHRVNSNSLKAYDQAFTTDW